MINEVAFQYKKSHNTYTESISAMYLKKNQDKNLNGDNMDKIALIESLYDEYIHSVTGPNNSLQIGRDSNKYRLLENNILFHECSYEEIQACLVYLCKTSLINNVLVATYNDHFCLWSWCINLLIERHGAYYDSEREPELKMLFEMCSSAAMSIHAWDIHAPMEHVRNYAELHSARNNYFSGEFNNKKGFALSYLCFPLLESVTRKYCNEYVNYDGTIKKDFTITQNNGNSREYKTGKTISNLCHMLYLVTSTTKDEKLKKSIISACEIFKSNNKKGFEAIFSWRNSSLHGESNHAGIGAALFTLSLLVMLDKIKNEYNQHKKNIIEYNFIRLRGAYFNSSTVYIPDLESLGEVKPVRS